MDFYVDDRVLIPRNDTEVMVDEVINHVKNTNNDYVLLDI
jgi:methylase of polypeptide subunit release factors